MSTSPAEDTNRRPFMVYLVWHPDSEVSRELGHALFRHLCQDPGKPLQPGLHVPVRFRCQPQDAAGGAPAPIPLDRDDRATADKTAIIVFIDDKMLLDRGVWGSYVADLWDACKDPSAPQMLLPVMVSKNAHKLHDAVAQNQGIRLTEDQREPVLCNRVTHELCRLALDRKRAPGDASVAAGRAPVTVFLSHSKHDQGKEIAEEIRDYIAANVQMKSFFDAVDIPPGSSWREVLDQASSNVGMLSILTDTYATRPWCRREILNAKRGGVPLQVVDALSNGEPRSFPYIGNVPTQRWQPKDPFRFENALGALLIQVLKTAYQKARLERLKRLYKVPEEQLALTTAPELLIAHHWQSEGRWRPGEIVIYPDPPLGSDELAMVSDPTASGDPAQQVRLITPTMLPHYFEAKP